MRQILMHARERIHTRSRLMALFALLAITAAVILACGGGASANSGSTTSGGTSASGSSKHFKVGDQVKVGNTYIVTVNSVKTSQGDEVIQPKSGNTFMIIDVTLKNVSNKEQDVSSLLMFTLKDSTGQQYDETVVDGATSPDGKLEAGDVLRGQIAYEVPKSQHTFTFGFEADITSSGQTIWDLKI
jgi:hypothetical protein